MNIFDFVTQNQSSLEQLVVGDDGEIELPVDQYDFSHPDVTVVTDDDDDIVFELTVGMFTLRTRIGLNNLQDAIQYIKKASTPGLRREVVEAIETKYRGEAESNRDLALEEVKEAQSHLATAQQAFDEIVDSLQELKGAWNVP